MIGLLYALMLGVNYWPISEVHTWIIFYELTIECISLYSIIIYNVISFKRG